MGGKGGSLSVKLQVITEVMGHNITEQGKQHIQSYRPMCNEWQWEETPEVIEAIRKLEENASDYGVGK